MTASAITTQVVSDLAVLDSCMGMMGTIQRVQITDLVVGLF